MNLAKILQYLRPGAEWVIRGDQIEWLDTVQTQPTDAEIQEKLEEAKQSIAMDMLRQERNRLLSECDFRALPDYPGADKSLWLNYRQALRDLPATAQPTINEQGELTNVVFPTKPE